MTARTLCLAALGALLVALLGCRSGAPDLRPPYEPDQFNAPTNEARFNTPSYPKQAFNSNDPNKRLGSDLMNASAIAPMSGPGAMPGAGMGGPGGSGFNAGRRY